MKKRLFTTALAATVLAALLCPAMSAQQRIEVSWAELARAFDGRVVSTVLLDGTVVQGRVLDVSPGELRFEVKKTSNRELYPKGELALARVISSSGNSRRLPDSGLPEGSEQPVSGVVSSSGTCRNGARAIEGIATGLIMPHPLRRIPFWRWGPG